MADESVADSRRRTIWALFDFSRGRGLEVGPLHSAIALRGRADVRYLDVFSRDRLVDTYRDDPLVDTDLIPEIDYSLSDGDVIRALDEAAAPGAPFDWVMASHVIEHVPDLVGWLRQLASIVRDDGALVLAVPDRRYCFDVLRPPTTVGQLLQAYFDRDQVPSVRAVYDYFSSKVPVDTPALWAGERPPGYAARENTLEATLGQVALSRDGVYVDAHVWTFTPESFADQVVELRALGLHDWRVESVEAPHGLVEFYAVLRRLPRDGSAPADLAAEPGSHPDLPDWLALQHEQAARIAALEEEVAALRRQLAGGRSTAEAEPGDI